MPIATITLTAAGIDALVDAQNAVTAAIEITGIGLANAPFTAAPTLTALPHEFKRIPGIGGEAVSENMIHLVAQDSTTDVYSAYGFGLYLADGTLFGAYSQVGPVVNKVDIASFLIAIDIAFQSSIAAAITFGNADFLNPPATETVRGVARIATDALADAGVDDATIMTPKKVKRVLDAAIAALNAAWTAFQAAIDGTIAAFETSVNGTIAAFETSVNGALAALQGRTITGGGLASGGGDLTANRVITVTAASGAELIAATDATKAVTPASFGAMARLDGTTSYEHLPGGTLIQRGKVRVTTTTQQSVSLTFPISFADTNYDLQLCTVIPGAGDYDNMYQEVNGSRTVSGVTLYSQDPSSGGSSDLAGFNWRAEGRG